MNEASVVESYLNQIQKCNNEAAKVNLFSSLLSQLFGLSSDLIASYLEGIETSLRVKTEGRLVRGRVDNLFGHVVIEFEKSLNQTREHAMDQVSGYIDILWKNEEENRRPYLGIISDGVKFEVFYPHYSASQKVELQIVETIDWAKSSAEDVLDWLDRYFVRKYQTEPSSANFLKDFGPKSHSFLLVSELLETQWKKYAKISKYDVLFQNWNRYLAVVYGKEIGDTSLFVRHTYLATVAKLLSWKVVTGRPDRPTDSEIQDLINGRFFQQSGIYNFVDEDFFAWISRPEAWSATKIAVQRLYSALLNYDLSKLKEDILKEIYQNLVDPLTRKYLGEFYTPDWLADKIVTTKLKEKPQASLLDPSCGSGTFLYLAIHLKKNLLKKMGKKALLNHITKEVCGIDVHPLAVMIARTNFLLALGDLLSSREEAISIPIYLADSVRLPENYLLNNQIEFQLEDQVLHVSKNLLARTDYDKIIQVIAENVHDAFMRRAEFDKRSIIGYIQGVVEKKLSKEELESVGEIARVLRHFLDIDRNSIWAFVLKNIYKPNALKNKFDFVFGNPPWITYSELDPVYQTFVKNCVRNQYRLLESKKVRLMPHLEIATLFTVRCADLYLRENGEIAFVLPRSLLVADQHSEIRSSQFTLVESSDCTLSWREIWDCEGVKPLFDVPTCVVIGEKTRINKSKLKSESEIPALILSGRLSSRNAGLEKANSELTQLQSKIVNFTAGTRHIWTMKSAQNSSDTINDAINPYQGAFKQGATILPRRFWFVRPHRDSNQLGRDSKAPLMSSDQDIPAKQPYDSVRITGKIEAEFIYSTFITEDVIPFALIKTRSCILPISKELQRLLAPQEARELGYIHLANWEEKVEEKWRDARGDKKDKLTALQRLDFQRTLTNQSFSKDFVVVYNAGGKHLTSAVIRKKQQGTHILIDHKFYYYETDALDEAYYLCAVLNSPWLSGLVNEIQTQGNFGERDIHTRPLEYYFDAYNSNLREHRDLVVLAKESEKLVTRLINSQANPGRPNREGQNGALSQYKSTAQKRKFAREVLESNINKIDKICRDLFSPRSEKAS
jgi:hypothetical protein